MVFIPLHVLDEHLELLSSVYVLHLAVVPVIDQTRRILLSLPLVGVYKLMGRCN